MATSNPGIRVFVKDVYNVPTNTAPYAERIVIIAKHGTTPGDDIADRLYTPIPYTNVIEVVEAYGSDADALAAFHQVVGAGGSNVFIVATPKAAPVVPVALEDVYSPDEYAVYLALQHIDAAQPDQIVLLGYEVNKEYTVDAIERVSKVAKLLVDKCNEFTEEGFPCYAVVHPAMPAGTDVITSAVTVQSYLDQTFTTAPAGYATMAEVLTTLGEDADKEDLGKYLVYVLGEVEMLDFAGFYPAVGDVAGVCYSLGVKRAAINAKIPRVRNIRYNFTKGQRSQILDAQGVPVALDTRGYAIVVDGVSCAGQDGDGNDSVYERLRTVRLAFEIIKSLRRIGEGAIGLPASTETFNSLQTLMTSYLGKLKSEGLLDDAGVTFDYIKSEYKLVIDADVVEAGDIRNIDLRIGVRLR